MKYLRIRYRFFPVTVLILPFILFLLFPAAFTNAVANQSWDIPPGPTFDRTTEIKVSCVYYQKDIEAIIGLDDFGPLAMNGKDLFCAEPFNLYDAIKVDLKPGTAVTLCLSDGKTMSGLECMAARDDSLVTTVFEGNAGVDPAAIQRNQQEQGIQEQISGLSRSARTLSVSQTESYLASIRSLVNAHKLSLPSSAIKQIAGIEQTKQKKQEMKMVQAKGAAFTRPLGRGSQGDDVRRLQEFLARDSTLYPEGLITRYFGSLTELALQRFQAREGIVSSGDSATTGFGVVGPRTRARLNELFR